MCFLITAEKMAQKLKRLANMNKMRITVNQFFLCDSFKALWQKVLKLYCRYNFIANPEIKLYLGIL
jgi:hypothetical protein